MCPGKTVINNELGDRLSDSAYLRERVSPSIRDEGYLCCLDLRHVVAEFAAQVQGRVFDYGCGGAPYRSLFSHCQQYVGADVVAGSRVDRLLRPDGMTAEPDASFDAILSAQVLEHVPDPITYLQECRRILKPGGLILITTHGMFMEHGCPDDFHRWTSRGLEGLMIRLGFVIRDSKKLTTEIRGAIQLLHYFADHFRCPGHPLRQVLFGTCRRVYRCLCIPLLNLLGRSFGEQGTVPASDAASLYIGVAVQAQKPS